MKKFEYKLINFRKKGMNQYLDLNKVETTLTGLGLERWELVESFDSVEDKVYPSKCFVMKREIADDSEEALNA